MKDKAYTILEASGLDYRLVEEIVTIGRLKKVRQGQLVAGLHSTTKEIPMVLEGLLKVMRQDQQGNEVFLYYLEGGETCAMSITCCLEGKPASYQVLAEEDSALWMIPISYLDDWVVQYRSFRRFVFNAYQVRFEELLTTIDSVVFHKMDSRLYKYLLDTKQATGSFNIRKTHQQIADELSTSRVVISRLLKQLEKEGKIEQHRHLIEIL